DGLAHAELEVRVLQRAARIAADEWSVIRGRAECLKVCDRAKSQLAAEQRAATAKPHDEACRQGDRAMAEHTEALRERLRNRVGHDVFDAWFAELECEDFSGAVLVVSVPSKVHAQWIERDFSEELRACASTEFRELGRVDVKVRGTSG